MKRSFSALWLHCHLLLICVSVFPHVATTDLQCYLLELRPSVRLQKISKSLLLTNTSLQFTCFICTNMTSFSPGNANIWRTKGPRLGHAGFIFPQKEMNEFSMPYISTGIYIPAIFTVNSFMAEVIHLPSAKVCGPGDKEGKWSQLLSIGRWITEIMALCQRGLSMKPLTASVAPPSS